MIEFSAAEKEKFFGEIVKNYYKHNFGTMMKADVDLLIFSAYLDHCKNNNQKYDDYTIAKELGLTENRVRSLKERKELKYPSGDINCWKKEFVKLIPNAIYNQNKELVQMCIEDVNLMREVRHHFIEHNYFDEYQLNSKVLQCNLNFFIDVCNSLEEDGIVLSDDCKKELRKLSVADGGAIEKIIAGDFGNGFKELLKSTPEALKAVLQIVNPSNLTLTALTSLIEVVIKQI